jgi:F-box and leucine-rich repeat protein 2/20
MFVISEFMANDTIRELYLDQFQNLTDRMLLIIGTSLCIANLLTLDLSSCKAITADVLCQVLFRAPKLQRLILEGCSQLYDIVLVTVSSECTDIRHLSVANCRCTDEGVTALAEACHELESLNLSGNRGVGDESIISISQHLLGLQCLDLSHCFFIRLSSSIEQLCRNIPTLVELRLSFSNLVTKSTIDAIAQYAPQMQTLSLCCNPSYSPMTNTDLMNLAMHCTSLTELSLLQCSLITDVGVAALIDHCPSLRKLDLSYNSITQKTLNKLVSDCPTLKELVVVGCKKLTGQMIDDMIARAPDSLSVTM